MLSIIKKRPYGGQPRLEIVIEGESDELMAAVELAVLKAITQDKEEQTKTTTGLSRLQLTKE